MYVCAYACVYIYIYIIHFFWWYCFVTTNLTGSWSPLSLETPDTGTNIWCPQENVKPHENRRSSPWAYTPTKTHIHTTHIYTTISKCPLPTKQMQKSSFLKFTTNSIKTYTSQCNKNMIHNLSDHTLTEDEFSVLTKGLSFVPTQQINPRISSRLAC